MGLKGSLPFAVACGRTFGGLFMSLPHLLPLTSTAAPSCSDTGVRAAAKPTPCSCLNLPLGLDKGCPCAFGNPRASVVSLELPENWTDTRETLLEGMLFSLKYMGMTLVEQPKGEELSAAAVKRIVATVSVRAGAEPGLPLFRQVCRRGGF